MCNKRKKWLIVFPDTWISYSPSCLNLVRMIEEKGDSYSLVYVDAGQIDNKDLNLKSLFRVSFKNTAIVKFLKTLKLFNFVAALKVFHRITKCGLHKDVDVAVGFDCWGYLIAQLFEHNAIYYSLEVSRNVLNKIIFNYLDVRLLIIQSKERKNYLAGHKFEKVAYIQNSNFFDEKAISQEKLFSRKLVYVGNIIAKHGVEESIDALHLLDGYTLFLKGINKRNDKYVEQIISKYKSLIEENRLILDFEYVNQGDLTTFLSKFDIGLCFYSYELTNDFNYLSSPSGKMFSYFCSGNPVVGSNFLGLKPIEEYSAGMLIDSRDPRNIFRAVKKIEKSYSFYRNNALRAAKDYDFRKLFLASPLNGSRTTTRIEGEM